MQTKNVMAVILGTFLFLAPIIAFATTIPGTSDLWLSGMPNGSTASLFDSAPGQSPVLIGGLNLLSGGAITFAVSGAVSNGPCCVPNGPDGGAITSHLTGVENGISGLVAPFNALIGLFLDGNQPDTSPAPSALDFGQLGIGFNSLAPALKQPFFIGDGLTGTGTGSIQTFLIPKGATRLFLGTMDSYEWNNNIGGFEVNVSAVPEPNALVLILLGLVFFGHRTRLTRRFGNPS